MKCFFQDENDLRAENRELCEREMQNFSEVDEISLVDTNAAMDLGYFPIDFFVQ